MEFSVFSNAKINLGLKIISKLSNGYHQIESILLPIELSDKIIFSDNFASNQLIYKGKQIFFETENTVSLAIKFFSQIKPLPKLNWRIEKNIPIGAGLGGGSSNAAFTLLALKNHFYPDLNSELLFNLARKIGADCPFFLINKPVLATGIGDVFETIDLNLADFNILLVKPEFSISTKFAYSLVDVLGLKNRTILSLKKAVNNKISEWKNLIFNDFEEVLFPKYPILAQIKNQMYEDGAIYSSLTGTGSTVYGLFPKNVQINPEKYQKFNPEAVIITKQRL